MARLALAVLFVAAFAVAGLVLALGLKAVLAGGPDEERRDDSPMQKIAFALLVALILYVAFQGAA